MPCNVLEVRQHLGCCMLCLLTCTHYHAHDHDMNCTAVYGLHHIIVVHLHLWEGACAGMQDNKLQRTFAKAIEEVYSGKSTLRAEADGGSLMYCFCAAQDCEAPRVASDFVRDVAHETRGAYDVCALLVVSVLEMTVRAMQLHVVRCLCCACMHAGACSLCDAMTT